MDLDFSEATTQKKKNLKKNESDGETNAFVLVHGGCHGAWCWYKIKPRLEKAGHRVSAMDLTAAGVNVSRLDEVQTLSDYSRPLLELLESLDSDQKVIIVGHSLGGPSTALAMEMFPRKISVAVFVSSFMPDTAHSPAYVLDKIFSSIPQEEWFDTEFGTYGHPERSLRSVLLGPKHLADGMYQHSPVEDLELAKTLVRVAPLLSSHLDGEEHFTDEGYGSVRRVYIVCGNDKAITEEQQRWMIHNFPVEEVMEIKDADHMPMFSKPEELFVCLCKIANKLS